MFIQDAPIFLFIHGGYWQEFTKDLSAFAASSLVSQGIKVYVTGYDLCPKGTHFIIYYKILINYILKIHFRLLFINRINVFSTSSFID